MYDQAALSFDFSKLSPAQISLFAAAATIFAALLGGVFGLAVAGVNAWPARRLDVAKARREYFAKVLEPMFQQLDDDIVLCSQIVDILIPQTGILPTGVDRSHFDKLRDRLATGTIIDSTPTAIQAILKRRAELGQSYRDTRQLRQHVGVAAHAVLYLRQAGGDLETFNKEKVSILLDSAKRFETEAVQFRERVEMFMLNG